MIKILFFAHLQEAIGEASLTWTELPITVGNLKQKITETYKLPLQSVMVAVNEE